jgi:MFS family permease
MMNDESLKGFLDSSFIVHHSSLRRGAMSTSTAAPAAPTGLRGLPRNVWVVTAASFLTDVSSEMLVHLLPLFLANVLGVRLSIVGLIEGVAETTASLLKVFSGWLSDRLGDRKWLTVAGYSLSTLAKPFLYVANTWAGFGPAAPFLFGAAMALVAVVLLVAWLPDK